MPKVSVYLPDVLYDEVRRHDIAISAVAQRALEEEVRRHVNSEWIRGARVRKPRTRASIDTSGLLDTVRSEFGS